MAFGPAMGTLGRLRLGSGNSVVAGIKSWRRRSSVTAPPILHFESPADAKGTVTPNILKGPANLHVFTVAGYFNWDATDQTEIGTAPLSDGLAALGDFIGVRGSPTSFGFHNVPCLVTEFEMGATVDQIGEFTATLTVDGALPLPSAAA